MRKYIIKLLNGFTDLDDAIGYIKKIEDKEKKEEILKESVKRLYNIVSAEDILRQSLDGTWIFQGKPLTNVEVSHLKEEANMLKTMKLWYMIKQDIRYQIGKKIWEEAKCEDDILWGRLITFLYDIINTRIKKM